MNLYELGRIIANKSLENLYIGCVTVYKPTRDIYPECTIVRVPQDKDKIQYIAILEKAGKIGFSQIDNGQTCLLSNNYFTYSNFPVVTNPIKLKDFYKLCNNSTLNVLKFIMLKNKILEDARTKEMISDENFSKR